MLTDFARSLAPYLLKNKRKIWKYDFSYASEIALQLLPSLYKIALYDIKMVIKKNENKERAQCAYFTYYSSMSLPTEVLLLKSMYFL